MSFTICYAQHIIRLSKLYSSKYYKASSMVLNTSINNQEREIRTFSRIPKLIIPSKQDQGKLSIDDYVKKTSIRVNKEVLKEAREIEIAKSQDKASSESVVFTRDNYEEKRVDNRNSSVQHFWKSKKVTADSEAISVENSEYQRDPELQRALRAIKSELYEKTPAYYRKIITKCSSKKHRDEEDIIMLEGPKLVGEAISAGLVPEVLYFSRKNLLIEAMPKTMNFEEKVERLTTYKTVVTPYKILNKWSSVVKGQGLVGIFKKSIAANALTLRQDESRNAEGNTMLPPGAPITVLLDGVREPGNLGAILRTLAAVGAHKIVLAKGCCDPWEGKALRAGCGGHFHLQIAANVTWSAMSNVIPHFPTVFVADVCNGDRDAMWDEDQTIVGSDYDEETQSLLKAVDKEQRLRAFFRTAADAEAGMTESDEGLSESAPAGVAIALDEHGNQYYIDESYDDENHLAKYSRIQFPTHFYNEVEFFPSSSKEEEIVLVIGSETGLSNAAKKFVADNYGKQVSVPLLNNINSLNTSVATGVILYEVLRQSQKLSKQDGTLAREAVQE